ncbi:MAG: flagellar biosynthetic protein FliO [Spirochaetia bacterium]|nr:flagellar biosynthetic protein FliO [Spirochaetia bacterium]
MDLKSLLRLLFAAALFAAITSLGAQRKAQDQSDTAVRPRKETTKESQVSKDPKDSKESRDSKDPKDARDAKAGDRDPVMSEIDKSWMAEIKSRNGNKSNTAASDTTKSDSSQSEPGKGRPEKEDVKFSDPGNGSTDNLFSSKEEGPSFVSTVLRFFGLLAVMILGLYLVVRFIRMKNPALMPTGDLAVVMATVPLVQGKFLQIVELAGRMIVLGVSESGVNMIMPVDDQGMADKIRIWHSQKGRLGPATLMDSLTKAIKKTDVKFWPSRTDGRPDAASRETDFRDVLRQFTQEDTAHAASGPGAASVSARPAFSSQRPPASAAETEVSPTAALQALINRQKKKLDKLRTSPSESELPGMGDKA